MKRPRLSDMSTGDLVELFVKCAIAQDNALFANAVGEVNKLYWNIDAIKNELQSREGDQRRALLPLYRHPNPQVKLKAAKATFALAPGAARQVLETLANTCVGPQKLEAGMCLFNLDEGIFKPK